MASGTSRDMLLNCTLKADAQKADLVAHIHDGLMIEVVEEWAKEAYRALGRLMLEKAEWIKSLPLAVDGYGAKRFSK